MDMKCRRAATRRDISAESEVGNPTNEPLVPGRHILVRLRQVELDVREWRHGIYPRTIFARAFHDDHVRRYRWNGTSAVPVNLRGYKYPGRYPILPGVPLTFSATVREIWPDGTAQINRAYIRLDRQPESTRRAYAEKFGIPLHELGM